MRLKKISVSCLWAVGLFMFFLPKQAGAQSLNFCGTYQVPPFNPSNPDSIVYDRFGNIFHLSALIVPDQGSRTINVNSGYFNPFFFGDIPAGAPANANDVICEALNYIATSVPQRNSEAGCGASGLPVNLQIIWISFSNPDTDLLEELELDGINLLPSVAGIGTPFYSTAFDFNCKEVVHDNVFIKINGGNTWGNIFDGRLLINSDINWNYDIMAASNTFTGLDLYSTILHETLHIMGFASRMNLPEAYTMWDQTLRIVDQYQSGGGGANPIRVIMTNSSIGNNLNCDYNCWSENTTLTANISDLAINLCGTSNPDIVMGDFAWAAVGGYDDGSGVDNILSHLNPNCNNPANLITYVMSPGLSPGESRRVISDPEFNILCELGYRISSQNVSCNGCYVIANADDAYDLNNSCCPKLYMSCVGESVHISKQELLCNDLSNDKIDIIRFWTVNSNINITENGDGWDIINTSNQTFFYDPINILYTIRGCDCKMTNSIIVLDWLIDDCQPCSKSVSCENLLCIEDFENYGTAEDIPGYHSSIWFGIPILFQEHERVANNTIYNANDGNNYLSFFGLPVDNSNLLSQRGALALELHECIDPGCSLQLEMDIFSVDAITSSLEVWGSANPPCSALESPLTPIANTCGISTMCPSGNIFDPVCITTIQPTSIGTYLAPNFQPAFPNSPFIWANTTDQKICFLTLVYTPPNINTNGNVIGIDNVAARKTCEPSIICNAGKPVETCTGQIIDIAFQVCASNIPGDETSTLVTPDIALPSGWTLISGNISPFTLGKQGCQDIVLQVQIPTNAPINNTFNIVLNGTATGVCTAAEWSCEASVTVIDCTPVTFACGCPPGPNSYNIGAPNTTTLISDTNLPTNTTVSNACIAIHGELLIDDGTTTPISFATENCEFRMQPGASIRVGNKNTFNARLGSIRGCTAESMWRSIVTEDRSILQLRNVSIEDAQRAVVLSYKSEVTLAANHFARNYISVYSPPAPASPIAGLTFTCIANEFDCEGQTLHPAFDDQDIVFQPGAASWAGMFLNDIVTPINVGSFQIGNTFHHMANGIVLNNVPMGVYNATFSDITRSTLHPISLPMGSGVYAVGNGHPLIVQGVAPQPGGFPATPNFERCNMGVSTLGIPATITNNRMQQMGSGIRMDMPGEASLIVHDNWIGCDNIGIHAFQCAEANVLSIKRNEVRVDQNASDDLSRGTAIQLNDQGLSHQTCLIEDNDVWLYGSNFGISLNGSRTVRITENDLHLQNSSLNIAGIYLQNAGDNDVRCNNVTGVSQNLGSSNIALRINNCDATQYADNQFNHTRIGAQLENICMGTLLRANTYDAHLKGILLKSTLLGVDDQEHAGNMFLNISAPARGAEREIGLPTTRFFVHTTAAPFWPPNPLPSSGFIFLQPTGSPWTPGLDFCQLTPDPLDGKTDKDIEVAKGELEGAGALPWIAEKQLYRKLRLHPDLLQEAVELEEFKELYEYGALGRLDATEEKTSAMIKPAAALSAALTEGEEQVIAHIAYLQKLESNMVVAPDLEGLDDLAQQKAAASPVGDSLLLLLRAARADVATYRAPLLAQALAENNLASGADVWIANEKTVNTIYLQTAAQGLPVSAAQQAMLAAIAAQCPTEGGDAVFKARSLYAGSDWTTFFEVTDACGGSSFQQGSDERNSAVNREGIPYILQIAPNPATDVFQVRLSAPEGFNGFVTLSDLSGKTIQKVQISTSETVQLNPPIGMYGLFLCQLQNADGNVLDRQKVVILK